MDQIEIGQKINYIQLMEFQWSRYLKKKIIVSSVGGQAKSTSQRSNNSIRTDLLLSMFVYKLHTGTMVFVMRVQVNI